MEKDFAETQVLCRLVINYKMKMIFLSFFYSKFFFQVVNFAEMAAKGHALLNRIENITTDQERTELKTITGRYAQKRS